MLSNKRGEVGSAADAGVSPPRWLPSASQSVMRYRTLACHRFRPRLVIMVVKAASRPSERVTPAVLRQNRLLAALPEDEQERLGADLQLVELELRQLLYEMDQ